jgi:hypothetical protein
MLVALADLLVVVGAVLIPSERRRMPRRFVDLFSIYFPFETDPNAKNAAKSSVL